jgi:hypothetical protein
MPWLARRVRERGNIFSFFLGALVAYFWRDLQTTYPAFDGRLPRVAFVSYAKFS